MCEPTGNEVSVVPGVRRVLLGFLLTVLSLALAPAEVLLGQSAGSRAHDVVPLQTYAEASGWEALTPHEELVGFYREIAARSSDVRIEEIGRSRGGRPILFLTLARPAMTDPWEAHASGKPVVLIAAQVHGDEPGGKEGLMLFARDMVFGELSPLLDDVILLLVPQLNPDGAETGDWGARRNAAGYDLNRDYLRLVNPETRAIVERVIVPWRPHVMVDAHELTGSPRVYDFYTQHAEDLSGPDAPARVAREGVTTAIVEALEEAGYSYFIYHTHGEPDEIAEEGIQIGLYGGRNLRGYGGVHGAVSMLFESLRERDSRVGIEPRARSHRVAMEALVRYVAGNAGEVIAAVAKGREQMRRLGERWDPADTVAIQVDMLADGKVPYRMASMAWDADDDRWVDTGEVIETQVSLRDSSVVRLGRIRPVGYVVEQHREDVIRHLRSHGVQVERLMEEVALDVQAMQVDSVAWEDAPREGTIARSVWTTPIHEERTFARGTYLVRADQPLAPLAFQLLEPEDEDSYASSGWFSAEKSEEGILPVYRVVAWPARLPSEGVRWVRLP